MEKLGMVGQGLILDKFRIKNHRIWIKDEKVIAFRSWKSWKLENQRILQRIFQDQGYNGDKISFGGLSGKFKGAWKS